MVRKLGVAVLILAACGGGADPVVAPGEATPLNAAVGEPFTLAVGGQAVLEGGRLTVTLLGVLEDSRCPVDVTCVWEGTASLRFRVTLDGETRELLLDQREGAVDLGDDLRLVIETLEPEPRDGRTIAQADYRATLRVRAT